MLTFGIRCVIVGGESGAGACRMDPAWARDLRDQCQRAAIPFFFKQWGGPIKKKTGRLLDGRTWDEVPPAPRPENIRARPNTIINNQTNLGIGADEPADYIPRLLVPEAELEAQAIPLDPKLWRVDNYEAFLNARARLLAARANEYLG